MTENNAAHETAIRDAIRKAYDDGYNDAKMAPDNCSTYSVERAVRLDSAALLSKLRAPVAEITDRAMLRSVLQDLEKSEWVCPQCGHSESCGDMDVAYMIRDHLKGDASAPVADERANPNQNWRILELKVDGKTFYEPQIKSCWWKWKPLRYRMDYGELGGIVRTDTKDEALYWLHQEGYATALASAPVADESPMAKMAEALREKARQEQRAYQDRRDQAIEWGPMPVGTEADDPSALAALADGLESIVGNENAKLAAVIIRRMASAPAADTLPLEKVLHELVSKIDPTLDTGDILQDARRASTALGAIMESAPVAGEATYYAVMHGQALFGVFDTEAAADDCVAKALYPPAMSVRPLYAAPQASEADIIEDVAKQWDGCIYDAGPGGDIDIGKAIRNAASKHMGQAGQQRAAGDERAAFEATYQADYDDPGAACEREHFGKGYRAGLAAQPADKPAISSPSSAGNPCPAPVPAYPETGNSHTDGGAVYG